MALKTRRWAVSVVQSAAVAVALASEARAQVSATWVGPAVGTWNAAANWTSNPSIPDSFGTAVFNGGASTVSLDSVISLNRLRLDTASNINIRFQQIFFGATAFLDIARSKQSAPGTNYFSGHEFNSGISVAGGSTGPSLHIGGPGAAVFKGATSGIFTNVVIDNGDRLGVTGNLPFGSASSILLNTGTLRTLADSGTTLTAISIARPIQIHPNGGTLAAITAPMSITGNIQGGGTLNFLGQSTLSLETQNSFAGVARVIGGGTCGLTLNSGAMPFYNAMEVSGQLNVVYNSVQDALGLGTLALRGGTANLVQYNGSETIGTLSLVGGNSSLIATNATSGTFTLRTAALDRKDRGTLFIKADGLGGPAPANRVSRIFVDHPETIPHVGGGGAAGTPFMSIVPFAYTQTPAGTVSFLTYDAVLGLRPLNTSTEYVSSMPVEDISAANVRSFAGVINTPKTINSLVMSPGSTISGTGTITLTSGALVCGPTFTTTTFAAPLDFGSAEGIVAGINALQTPVSGTNGVTLVASNGPLQFGNNASNYTGTTTINSGTVQVILGADLVAGQPGPFGADSSPIVLAGRSSGAKLILNGVPTRVFGRNLLVRSDGDLLRNNEPVLQSNGPQVNGNLSLEGPLRIDSTGQATVINGIISGPGRLSIGNGTVAASATLAAANTFTGGVDVGNGIVTVLNDQALGTGTVFVGGGSTSFADGTLSIGQSAIAQRTISNPVVLVATMRLAGLGSLNLAGPIDLNGDARTISVQTPLQATVSGAVSGGDLVWQGAGTINGNNAQRSTFVNGGTLIVANSGGLGSSPRFTQVGTVSLPAGAAIELTGGVSIPTHPMTLYGTVRSSSGNNVWGGTIQALTPANFVVTSDKLSVNGGIDGSAITGGTGITKSGDGTLATTLIKSGRAVNVNAGVLQLIAGQSSIAVSKIGSLSIANNPGSFAAAFDITSNALVIDYSGITPVDSIIPMLLGGYAGGTWIGNGLRTSSGAAQTGYGIGVAESADIVGPTGGAFLSETVDETALLMRYTLYGDANLDGSVNLADFTRLASSFGSASIWSSGDFNYDGQTSLADFTSLAANFGLSVPAEAPRSGGAAVPEPVAAATGIGIALLGGRRRAYRTEKIRFLS